MWTPRVKQAQKLIVARALEALKPRVLDRPAVHVPLFSEGVALKVDWEDQEVSVSWCGTSQGELKRIFALLSALGWTIVRANIVREEDGAYKAEFFIRTVQQTLKEAAQEIRFIQSYNSRTYTELPVIAGEVTTAAFDVGGILVIRTVERIGALGHLVEALPDFVWLRHEVMGATMIVNVYLAGQVSRATVVGNVTRALARD